MFKFNFDYKFSNSYFYRLSIAGAVTGRELRAGYGVAMYGLGYKVPISNDMNFMSTALIGAGGGFVLNNNPPPGKLDVYFF